MGLQLKASVGTVKKSIAAMALPVIAQKSQQMLRCSGFLGARLIQRLIVVSDTSNPNIRSSPWM